MWGSGGSIEEGVGVLSLVLASGGLCGSGAVGAGVGVCCELVCGVRVRCGGVMAV